MRFFLGVLVTIAVLALGGLAFVWSGIYNVAAALPHQPLVFWALDTTKRNSVEARASALAAPEDLGADRAARGFGDYDEMCVLCHGAPGVEPTEWGKGLRPEPPDLQDEVARWTAPELFWILRNGIKMSGMPALGPTHSDEDLWNVVAFLQTLPDMTSEEYARQRQNAQSQ
ncbi:MAG: c-type cytochrome [Tranquillimonas sp.]|jgi:mono/diheme cytochrome c family protein